MANSVREQALVNLKAALDNVAAATKQREGVEPEKVPAAGLIILRDGEPGEPVEVSMSPLRYEYQHPAQVEVYVVGNTAEIRATALDGLLQGIATAVNADKTLAGAVDWAEVREPQLLDEDPQEGDKDSKRALVSIILHYSTTNPLG